MPEVDLDSPETYPALDVDDMYRRVQELPEQMEDAWGLSQEMNLPEDLRNVSNVVVIGMGGSAIGGSLLESYSAYELPIPFSVWRGYGLPSNVGPNTLVVVASFSGNTEETLSGMEAARSRGAKIVAITTGGRVLARATEWNIPLLHFQYDAQPRAALGYLFTPLVGIMARLDFLPDQEGAMRESITEVRAVRDSVGGNVPEERNVAKQLARDAFGRIVVAYGAEFLGAVGRRWKTQVNENSKQWAFYEEFSELNHNAIVGYEYPHDLASRIQVFVLNSVDLSDRIRTRIRVTDKLMDEFGVRHRSVEGKGRSRLAQMYTLIALGDYTTYYLALLNGVDPSEIKPIDLLKNALAASDQHERDGGIQSLRT